MSPVALELLSKAYENHLKAYERYFSYQFKNRDDLVHSINGAAQLFEDGYVDNVSDNVTSSRVSIVPVVPITFRLTDSGIKYMRSYRESKS